MVFNPDIILETPRLILRYMRFTDKHDIFVNISHDKDVLKYFIDKYLEQEEESRLDKTIDFCLKNERYLFAIVLKETNETIGMILQCSTPTEMFNTTEVGYAIGKKHWNKGYTSEALDIFIDFMFSLGIHKVTASCFLENVASKRVMEKCEMMYEGIKKDEVYYHDKYNDLMYYYLINPRDK
ncbi:MAG: GNAT family N-acetyltransferase [Bacilli bacterium]|nr:GNAT family N-acetyltransferase [Bacilli bacterium]